MELDAGSCRVLLAAVLLRITKPDDNSPSYCRHTYSRAVLRDDVNKQVVIGVKIWRANREEGWRKLDAE